MSLSLIAAVVMVLLAAGYLFYGRFIARQYRLSDSTPTPATLRNDGVDFIPTRPFYLLAQHFSAIAAAGPIAGPILACIAFGWGPCLLWIVCGVILIGAVHDFSALIASVRHGASSIAEIARLYLGRRAYLALVAFIWIALLYVIVAFTQMTAGSFVGKAEEFVGLATSFNKGGAVAASSTLYLLLALVLGVVQRFLRPPLWLITLVFVPATLGCVWAGAKMDAVMNFPATTWYVAILVYCCVASMLPMWLLQQPRGYLGGFVLYLAIGVGAFGIFFGGFEIRQPIITDRALETLNPISAIALYDPTTAPPITSLVLPFLFVTIACGACSGFHGLICGGTTSKQIARESHCRAVGFGAMLLEGFVAVISLATVMMLAPAEAKGLPPARIYGDGLANYLTLILGKDAFFFCATFGAMAFSTFVFDTLDVSTRLGRYLLQELFGATSRVSGLLAAGATAGIPLLMLLTADANAYLLFWTLFGTSNQLLASLTLLGVTVWLKRTGRPCWFAAGPMAFVMAITLWALAIQVFVGFRDIARGAFRTESGGLNPAVPNGVVALILFGLAAAFILEALRAVRKPRPA